VEIIAFDFDEPLFIFVISYSASSWCAEVHDIKSRCNPLLLFPPPVPFLVNCFSGVMSMSCPLLCWCRRAYLAPSMQRACTSSCSLLAVAFLVNRFFDVSTSCPLDLTIAVPVLGPCCLPLCPLSFSSLCTGQACLHGTFHAACSIPFHPLHRTGAPAGHLPCSAHWICRSQRSAGP
jgi:hypothetical protein